MHVTSTFFRLKNDYFKLKSKNLKLLENYKNTKEYLLIKVRLVI